MTTPDTNISVSTPAPMTLADLREFVESCQRAGIAADTPLKAQIRLAGWLKHVEARTQSAPSKLQ